MDKTDREDGAGVETTVDPNDGEGRIVRFERSGLSLAGRVLNGSGPEGGLPLVCLPGLSRNSRDFVDLAAALTARGQTRPIVGFDYRGRGLSAWCESEAAYAVPEEAMDLFAGLDHCGFDRAILLGTSRGVLVTLVAAMIAPQRISGAIFNDAAPRIEAEGLRPIRDYLAERKIFASWEEATAWTRDLFAPTFPALGAKDFEQLTRTTHVEREGAIVADCDPRLADLLKAIDFERPLPELWEAFDKLVPVPILVLRGEHSTLLSEETCRAMAERHPDCAIHVVPGQGHPPMLETGDLPDVIARFLDRVEAGASRATAG